MNLDPLFERIRASVSERGWSAGVRLARSGQVIGAGEDDDEIRLSVSVPARTVALTVYLWPDDVDWGCDCGKEACVHAVAAIIALNQARKSGDAVPTARDGPRLRYALERTGGGLKLTR